MLSVVLVYRLDHTIDIFQIDWYTDFYFPFVKKWAERVQSVSSLEKLIFAEPIPNEVRVIALFLAPTLRLFFSLSSVLNPGHRNEGHRTLFMRLIGKNLGSLSKFTFTERITSGTA